MQGGAGAPAGQRHPGHCGGPSGGNGPPGGRLRPAAAGALPPDPLPAGQICLAEASERAPEKTKTVDKQSFLIKLKSRQSVAPVEERVVAESVPGAVIFGCFGYFLSLLGP